MPAARFLINVLHSVTVGKNVSLHLRGRKRDRRDGTRGSANPPRSTEDFSNFAGKEAERDRVATVGTSLRQKH